MISLDYSTTARTSDSRKMSIFFPLIFINSRNLRTIPLGIQIFFGEYSIKWDLLFAALNISIIPVIILFLILSRQFIAGLTEGAIK